MEERNPVSGTVIAAAIEVHRLLGLGLLASGLLINFNVRLLKEGLKRMVL